MQNIKHQMEIQARYAQAFAQARVGVDGPDKQDIRGIRDALWASDFGRDVAKMHADQARVGAFGGARNFNARRTRVGANPNTAGAGWGVAERTAQAGCPTPLSGYAMGPAPQDCLDEVPCHAHLLGFTSFTAPGGFPLAGGTTAILNVQPQNAVAYKPAYLFWEMRDNAAGLGAVIGLMTDARISGQPQFTSGNGANLLGAIPSSAFSVDTPLDVRTWQRFSSINNQQLALTFSNPGAPAVLGHVLGVFWGDNAGAA
jgi:hypothetical protein